MQNYTYDEDIVGDLPIKKMCAYFLVYGSTGVLSASVTCSTAQLWL